MPKTVFFIIAAIIYAATAQGQNLVIPEHYSIVDSVLGDLDGDNVAELVVAYNTYERTEEAHENIPRELIIYKADKGNWVIWQRSLQALYGSSDGGMMGDPFGELIIERGVLKISHYGGSRWKWSHIDKYGYRNGDFYLVGFESNYGALCEYWETVDFNLTTGKLFWKKEHETCEEDNEDETTVSAKFEEEMIYQEKLEITLQNRRTEEIIIVTPKYGNEIYVSTKDE